MTPSSRVYGMNSMMTSVTMATIAPAAAAGDGVDGIISLADRRPVRPLSDCSVMMLCVCVAWGHLQTGKYLISCLQPLIDRLTDHPTSNQSTSCE